ncbi:MAG TPA: hypothetical protein VG206_26235 [Terriglobia bacterium]|nr:hypothetical protein [Terriglobia bacterium]
MSKRDQLDSYLKQVEKRLRLHLLLRGAAILTSVALIATTILVLVTNALAFSEGSVSGARAVLFCALAAALALGLALPLYALNRRRTARRIESVFPLFQQRLLTFVDRGAVRHEPIMELLAADTLDVARNATAAWLVPDRKLLTSIAAGVACLGILIWMVVAGPGFLGYGSARLWAGSTRSTAAFYDIRVTPGDAVVRRNASQTVTAQLIGFESPQARLYARSQSASKWEEAGMRPQAEGPGFQFVFAGLPEDVEYFVEAGLVRSHHFKIRVTDLPSVKKIRVTYHYPAWTGLHDLIEEHGGDLHAVEGSEAELSILTDRPVNGGALVLDNQQIALSGQDGNLYQGTIRIEKDGQYHVAALDQGQLVRLSDDFFIEAGKVNPPEVSIARPGGDYRASPIEEVSVSVTAHDDYGLNDVSLHYSVNGAAEQTVGMLKQRGAKAAEGSATLSLEDFKLVPGDVVSVYAKAKDAKSESRSGMVFIQVEPFEREYSQAQSAGGGGMGGQEFDITQREKEVIGATWQQQSDKTSSKQQAAEAAKFLSGVQSKLRDQALTLAGRLQSRELSEENEEFNAFQKEMNAAAEAMAPASEKLQRQRWDDALPAEQKALQHLLRAEATFRKIQVAFGGGGGGGGAGAGAGGDLANLLNLELDTEKNQYEAGQTAASQSQRAEQVDEALQKLDELARRQQGLADQQHDASNQGSQQRWQQEMLRREAEQLQKQMEQLAQGGRQGQQGGQASSQSASSAAGGSSSDGRSQATADQRIQRALDQLRQANDDMRRAASQGQTAADARRAADRLQEATKLLGGIRQQQGSGQLDSLAREADRLADQEHKQADRIRQMFGNKSSAGPQRGSRAGEDEQAGLADNRQLLASDLSHLEKSTQDTMRQLAPTERDAASKLHQALGEMDGSNLAARLEHSAQSMRLGLPPDASLEPSISGDIDRFDQRIHEAQQALKGQQPSAESALARLERLRDQIATLTRNPGGPNSRTGASQSQSGEQAQQARGGQGSENASGLQSGGPGGPRTWQNGARSLSGNEPEGSGTEPYDSSTEPTRQRALRELDGLRRDIGTDSGAGTDIQELTRDLQRVGPGNFGDNPALMDQLRARVLATMDNLELRLRREFDQQESGQVRNSDSLRVPPGYQESVAEYFRRLSKAR